MIDKPPPQNTPKKQKLFCFVIGPIGKDGSIERKHSDLLLNAVIKQVLKNEEFNYDVRRADEDADPGMIGDRVVSDIINADLVVADLTDLNPNAFYELGIRHSIEKPTIHIAKHGTQLPFDNVAHRTIFVDLADWQSIEQARNRLAESAKATQAPGYKVSNPITQANASFKMRQSEDPRDRVIAGLQERLGHLESRILKSSSPARPPDISDEEEWTEQDAKRQVVFEELIALANSLREKKISDDKIINELQKHVLKYEDKPTKIYFDSRDRINFDYPDGVGWAGVLKKS